MLCRGKEGGGKFFKIYPKGIRSEEKVPPKTMKSANECGERKTSTNNLGALLTLYQSPLFCPFEIIYGKVFGNWTH